MQGRRMRYLSIVFGLALMVIVGGIMALVATRPTVNLPASPGAGASPSATLAAQPLDTRLPNHQPSAPPPGEQPTVPTTAEPTLAPTTPVDPSTEPSPSPGASPVESPAASPLGPAPTPAAPTREVSFGNLGLDSAGTTGEEPTTPRFFTFSAEGPGVIRVQLSGATGRVRACITPGEPGATVDATCRAFRRGQLERELAGEGPRIWTISLIGAQISGSPSTAVRLSFPTNHMRIRLAGFRFQGAEIPGYNGFGAELTALAGGELTVTAELDDGEGGAHPYRLVIQEVGGGPAQADIYELEGSSLSEASAVSAERRYQVTLENREHLSDSAIMLSAELAWP